MSRRELKDKEDMALSNAKDEPTLTIRKAEIKDKADLLSWRNDPSTVGSSFSNKSVTIPEHEKWYMDSLKNPDRYIYILCLDDKNNSKVGQVRFDKKDGLAEVAIVIAPGFRGKGFGKTGLMIAVKEFFRTTNIGTLIAKIKDNNIASIKSFKSCGFADYKKHDGFVELRLIRDIELSD